jgi:hypothetical protein
MSDKIITEIVLEGEKEAIAGIQRVGKAADATFADLQNVQLNFDFIEPQKGLKSLTDLGQRFASSMKNTGNIVSNVFAGISSAFRNAGSIGGGVFSELTRSLQATSLMAKAAGVQVPQFGKAIAALGRTVDTLGGGMRDASLNTTKFGQIVATTGHPAYRRVASRFQSWPQYRRHGIDGYRGRQPNPQAGHGRFAARLGGYCGVRRVGEVGGQCDQCRRRGGAQCADVGQQL